MAAAAETKTNMAPVPSSSSSSSSLAQQQQQQQQQQSTSTTTTMMMSTMKDSKDDVFAKLFNQLDPILKSLLEKLTELKSLLPNLLLKSESEESSESEFESESEDNNGKESMFIFLINNIVIELESLSQSMQQTQAQAQAHAQHAQQQHQQQHANVLCVLADYITLPLTAIFHLPLKEILVVVQYSDSNDNNNDKDDDELSSQQQQQQQQQARHKHNYRQKIIIRKSSIYKLYRAAAFAIQIYVNETTIASSTTTATPCCLLKNDYLIKYLIALINSMPSYSNIMMMTTTKNKMGDDQKNNNSNSSLDDGSDSWVTILNSVRTILICFNNNENNKSSSVEEKMKKKDDDDDDVDDDQSSISSSLLLLNDAWHGTLLMRLVDCLTAFLATASTTTTNKNSEGDGGSTSCPFFSSRVHRAALDTLLSLLQITTNNSSNSNSSNNNNNKISLSLSSRSSFFWRSVFPGVFTALFQQIMMVSSSKSASRSKASLSIIIPCQTLSLECMIILLRVSLCNDDSNNKANEDDTDDNHQYEGGGGGSNATASSTNNDDLLLRLTSMVAASKINNNNNNSNNDDDGSKNEDQQQQQQQQSSSSSSLKKKKNNQEDDITNSSNSKNKNKNNNEFSPFLCQIRKRIVGPIIILLRQMSISSSDNIRKQVLILCRVILLDTPRYCWQQQEQEQQQNKQVVYSSPPSSSHDNGNNSNNNSSNSEENNDIIIMERIPFEICMAFQRDPNKIVISSARKIIKEYIESRYVGDDGGGKEEYSSPSSFWMVSRIIELVQKLSTLVHQGNGTELRIQLNLLEGYLQCLVNNDNNGSSSSSSRKEDNDKISSALVSSTNLRRSLIQLLDVELDSVNDRRTLAPVVLADDIHHQASSSIIQLRHLNNIDLSSLGRDILQTLGKLLGPKHGAIFVDEIISDFIEASFQMPTSYHSTDDNNSFVGWLHEWIGSLVVAREVLLGSFSTNSNTDINTNTEQHQRQAYESSSKKTKRRSRVLQSLASSILPLLIDSSLWNLPTENRLATVNEALPLQILQKNTVVVVLLLELIGTFFEVLRQDAESMLSTILYPVVDKIIHGESMLAIQNSGLSTLKVMSLSCGFKSTEDLIYAEQNQLIASMVGRLRLPGGSRIPSRNDAEEILSVTNTTRWTMEMIARIINKGNGEGRSYSSPKGGKASMVDLISLIDYRLDHLFLQKVLVDDDVKIVCSLHKAFFNYFLFLFKVKKDVTYSHKMKNLEKDSKQPWLNELSKFRKVPPADDQSATISTVDSSDCDQAEESGEGERGRLLDVTEVDITMFSKLIARDCYLLSYKKLESRISACDALTIAFEFLAFVGSEHDDPSDDKNLIKNSVLRQVADSWPSVRARLRTLSEEILLSKKSQHNNSSVFLVLDHNNSDRNNSTTSSNNGGGGTYDVGIQRIFLTNLFILIGTMCECSGDFFAERFRNDVWPVMACHLEDLLEQLQRQPLPPDSHSAPVAATATIAGTPQHHINVHSTPPSTKIREATPAVSRSLETRCSFQLSDTERQLIIAILTCLNRVIQQEDCGKAVYNVLGPIGFTLLPLLDDSVVEKNDDEIIQDLTMECLKNIMRIDCDILRRPLLELSGTRISCCPLLLDVRNIRSGSVVVGDDEETTSVPSHIEEVTNLSLPVTQPLSARISENNIVTRCNELLDFVETLPEQSLS